MILSPAALGFGRERRMQKAKRKRHRWRRNTSPFALRNSSARPAWMQSSRAALARLQERVHGFGSPPGRLASIEILAQGGRITAMEIAAWVGQVQTEGKRS